MIAALVSACFVGCTDARPVVLDEVLPRCDAERTSYCIEPDGRVVQSFPGRRARVDVLFVVDDSSSMCHEQHQLVGGLEGFYPDHDLRFAVVTTDVVTDGAAAGRFRVVPGTYEPESCELAGGVPDLTDCDGLPATPWLDAADLTRFDEETGGFDVSELTSALRCRLLVGTSGSEVTMGFEAVRQALTHPDQAGFLRRGASLVVIFATDGNDCSDGSDAGQRGEVMQIIGAAYAFERPHRICEDARNLEDSCTWASDDRVSFDRNGAPRWDIEPAAGPVLVHEGVTKPAREWCVDGDRDAVTALSEALRVDCPEGGCQNQLVARTEIRDVLIDAWLRANPQVAAEPDARQIAHDRIYVVPLTGGFDHGVRGDTDEPLPGCEGTVVGQGYRYQALAEMFNDYEYLSAWPLCVPGEPPAASPVPGLINGGGVSNNASVSYCLATAPPTCETDADCSPGATCERYFAGNPDFEYGVCSDFAVEVTLVRDDVRTVLEPDRDYRLNLEAQTCLLTVGHGAGIDLRRLPLFDALEVRYRP